MTVTDDDKRENRLLDAIAIRDLEIERLMVRVADLEEQLRDWQNLNRELKEN